MKNEVLFFSVVGSCHKVSGFLWDFLPKVKLKLRQTLPIPLQKAFGAVETYSEGEVSVKLDKVAVLKVAHIRAEPVFWQLALMLVYVGVSSLRCTFSDNKLDNHCYDFSDYWLLR